MKIFLIFLVLSLAFPVMAQYDAANIGGSLNNNNDDYNAQIRIERLKKKLREKQSGQTTVSPGIDPFCHALDVQLVDKLGSFKLLNVVEDKDLKNALQTASPDEPDSTKASKRKLAILNTRPDAGLAKKWGLPIQNDMIFNLKDSNVLSQFQNASFNYLLITTLEGFDENHIDGSTMSRSYEYFNGVKTGIWTSESSKDSNGLKIQNGLVQSGSSWKMETVNVSPLLNKEQSIHVTLRIRVYDTKSGELLGSYDKSHLIGRSYTASARKNNEMSMGDLYQAAADDMSNWERVVVEDILFPIKIVEVKDGDVLINRGSDSGIKLNSYYAAWLKGKSIMDPDTGTVLGYEELKVGKVLIRELQTQFSRGMITDDQGIKTGAVLRLQAD